MRRSSPPSPSFPHCSKLKLFNFLGDIAWCHAATANQFWDSPNVNNILTALTLPEFTKLTLNQTQWSKRLLLCVNTMELLHDFIHHRIILWTQTQCSPAPYHFHMWFTVVFPPPHTLFVALLLASLFPSRRDRKTACSRPALWFDVCLIHPTRWRAAAGGAESLREFVTGAWLTIQI